MANSKICSLIFILLCSIQIKAEVPVNPNENPNGQDILIDDSEGSADQLQHEENADSTTAKDTDQDTAAAKQDNPETQKKDFDAFTPKILRSGDFLNHLDEVSFCGSNMESILVLTRDGRAYSTHDFGRKWKSLQAQFSIHHSREKMNVLSLLQNPNDNQMVILVSKDGENLVTYNCGETMSPLSKGMNLRELTFHPSDATILAAIDSSNNLQLSQDKGQTWMNILQSVTEFNFARYSDEAFLNKKERIFALRKNKNKMGETTTELIYSDDYFKKWNVALKDVEFFKLTDCCVYVKTTNEKLKVADAFGNFYYFFDLEIEKGEHERFDSFNVVDNDLTFQTFGTMVHQYNTYSSNFLMKANWYGTDFKVLFDFLVCDQFMSMCDILPMKSLAGVILSNRYKEDMVTFRENIPKSKRENFDKISRLNNIEDFKMTNISYDFGETWKRIQSPLNDELGKPIQCGETMNCYLNLHLHSSFRDFSLPTSSKMMPGLMLATGNVGDYLITDKNDSSVGLFITEDGGLNWRMIKRGNYLFELMDNGSLIVVASRNYRTAYVEFSFDGGLKWHKLKFSNDFRKITSITTKKSHNIQKLLIDIENPEGYKNKSKVVSIDFSNLHERHCVHDKENPELSDYEEFVPHNTDSDNCFLGQEITILRKKPIKECFNPDDFPLVSVHRSCPCKASDFHCDFGFKAEADTCVFDQKLFDERVTKNKKFHSAYLYLDNYLNPPKHCKYNYFATTGYRRNFGNYCSGGEQKKTLVEHKCPGTFFKNLWEFIFKLSLITFVLFAVYHFGLHFWLIDIMLSVQDKFKSFKKKRNEKKEKKYKELQTDFASEGDTLKMAQDNADEDDKEERDQAEKSRKINSIFDEDEEEESPIPF
jgi:hypothetical protein